MRPPRTSSSSRYVWRISNLCRDIGVSMTNITRLHHALPLSPAIVKAINEMDESLRKAIDNAKAAGMPQGLVVALLHGQAHSQTAIMVS